MPTLYVTEPGAMLEKEAGRLLVTKADATLLAVPATRVAGVVVVGAAGVTTPALAFLLERGIELVFLTTTGAFRGRLSGALGKNIALRRQQYRRADDASFCLAVGRAIIGGKVRNARARCLQLDETNEDAATLAAAAALRDLLPVVAGAADRATLMGVEGLAARRYFGVLRRYLRPPWAFVRRERRPPPDPVNALLSLLYTLLHESCYAALEAVGLDPTCGFLHAERYGRASLALDLMEEFRPVIADSVALTLLNKRMLAPGDFLPAGGKAIHLSREGWRQVADEYERRLETRVRPPGVGRAITYRQLLEVQARALRHVILGEAEQYRPYLTR